MPVRFRPRAATTNSASSSDAWAVPVRRAKRTPADAEAWNNLCVALKSQKRFAEAVEAGLRSVGLNPQDPAAWFNLGGALKQSGQFERAAVAYNRTLGLNPGFVVAHVELCHSLYRLEKVSPSPEGKLDERIKAYQG